MVFMENIYVFLENHTEHINVPCDKVLRIHGIYPYQPLCYEGLMSDTKQVHILSLIIKFFLVIKPARCTNFSNLFLE